MARLIPACCILLVAGSTATASCSVYPEDLVAEDHIRHGVLPLSGYLTNSSGCDKKN